MGAQVSPSDIHQSKQRSVTLVLEDHNLEHAWFQLLIFNPTEIQGQFRSLSLNEVSVLSAL